MKIILFAGGSGTRFWPLSREAFPKQFQAILKDGDSTFQRHLKNLTTVFNIDDIYVQTSSEKLAEVAKENYPDLHLANIIAEPARRDVGPAFGLAMIKMRKLGSGNDPVLTMWSDNYIGNYQNFFKAIKSAGEFIQENPERLILLGEQPSFPNENLGWIEKGEKFAEKNGLTIFERKSFVYRPEITLAKEWFAAKTHLWNPGYFVSTPNFILSQYKKNNPEMYAQLEEIEKALDTAEENKTLAEVYPKMEALHFDTVVLEKLDTKEALVLEGNYQWQDPGTLYALKQFFQESDDANVTRGNVYAHKTKDTLIYNMVDKQFVSTIGLDGFIVVNTPDAVLVCHKDQIPEIKKMLKEFEGTELEKYL